MKNNANVVSTMTVPVTTHNWFNYGNQIICKFAALNEFIQNAISAIIQYTTGVAEKYFEENRIDVTIKKRKNGTYLYVQNNGITADIQKVLNYGQLNRDTALNQHGTGFKTAASFFNPTNDGWAFYTRNDEHIYRVMAPYSTEMTIEEISEWPFADWAVTCIEIKVDNSINMDDITSKELGFRYAYAIANGINLTLNNKCVRPVNPKSYDMKTGSFEEIINGEVVKFDYETHFVNDEKAAYYAKTEKDQGIYINVNDCFVQNTGVSLIHKRSADGKRKLQSTLTSHNSMNGMICTVNITMPHNHKVNMPFANTKNAINWEKAEEIANIIDDKIGSPFRDKYMEHIEAQKRKGIDSVCEMFQHKELYYYAKEVPVGNKVKADAVFYKNQNKDGSIDMNSIHTIVEFKPRNMTGAYVMQALNYLFNLDACHPAPFSRRIMLIGTKLTDDAKVAMKRIRDMGIEIEFYPYFVPEED